MEQNMCLKSVIIWLSQAAALPLGCFFIVCTQAGTEINGVSEARRGIHPYEIIGVKIIGVRVKLNLVSCLFYSDPNYFDFLL
jgi:hypothetical protein